VVKKEGGALYTHARSCATDGASERAQEKGYPPCRLLCPKARPLAPPNPAHLLHGRRYRRDKVSSSPLVG
jgi:hypothetical protein